MELALALKPLTVMSQLMGLNVAGFRLGRAYTIIILLIITSLIYPSAFHLAQKDKNFLSGVDSLILWTQLVGNVLCIFIVLGVGLFRPRQFLFPIENLRHIDIVFRFFGVEMDDRYFYRLQWIQVLVSLVVSTVLNFRNIYQLIGEKLVEIFFHWLNYFYAILLLVVTDFLFVDYLAVINKRFFELNKLLRKILAQNKHPPSNFALLYIDERTNDPRKQKTSVVWNVEKLRILHHDLCYVSKKVNKAFGLQQLVSIAMSLIMITGQLCEAYHFMTERDKSVDVGIQKMMWIIFYSGRLFHISYACSRTSNEASLTSSIIHEMSLQQVSSGLGAQMQHFSLQLIHENLHFNACGFFEIDFTLLCSIIGVVSTYLVILIQMDKKMQCDE